MALEKLYTYTPSTKMSYIGDDLDQIYTNLTGIFDGKAGGNIFTGGTGAGEDITFRSTSNPVKGQIFFGAAGVFDEAKKAFAVGTTTATHTIEVYKTDTGTSGILPILFYGHMQDGATSGTPTSRQLARLIYQRLAGATVVPAAGFDTVITTNPIIQENAAYGLYGINVEGPSVAAGKTLTTYYGIVVNGPGGSGTVTNKAGIVINPGAGGLGINGLPSADFHLISGEARFPGGVNSGGNVTVLNLGGAGANYFRGDTYFNELSGTALANVGFFTTAMGGGVKVIGIGNASTVPASNPTGGGVLYAQAGKLMWRGSSGTITQLAPA